MTIGDGLRKADKLLKPKQIKNHILKAEDLLCSIIKKNKAFLFTYPEKPLTLHQKEKFLKYINRLAKGEPLAYILKNAVFYNLDFFVNKNVLIPRPETEKLVSLILADIKNNKSASLSIADIGTGSGAIIITLSKNLALQKHSFFATDISNTSLIVAKKNAKKHGVNKKINFSKGNLLEPLKKTRINIIIANLPYVSKKEYLNSPDIKYLKYEPTKAITDNKNGLTLIKELLLKAPEYLTEKGTVYLEIGYDQGTPLETFIKKNFPKNKTRVLKDLCGFDRYLITEYFY